MYLTDDNNPTGYSQTLEETTQVGSGSAVLTTTYVLGGDVVAQSSRQSDGSYKTLYLIKDGHGNTRVITDASGTVLVRYNYDSFGNALNFDPSSALTTHLLADGVYNSSNGFEYQRARWRSNFEFTQRDDDGYGNSSDPISLHKYLYANADAVNNWDPTGMFTQGMGYAAEAAIQAVYAADHPGNVVSYGGWTRLGIPGGPAFRLKPDIFNTTTKRWAEIKPLSPSGIVKAAAQLSVYSTLFAPFFYFPDASWTPSTHFAVAGIVPIVFFNVAGIIFYSDAIDAAEDLIALTTLAALRSFMASQLGQRLAQSLVEVLGDKIPALVSAGTAGDEAELGDSLGIAGLLGTLGLI
jgi:hypothetical protein